MWAGHGLAAEIRSSDFITGISTFAPGAAP
jgi:hypothetical protein